MEQFSAARGMHPYSLMGINLPKETRHIEDSFAVSIRNFYGFGCFQMFYFAGVCIRDASGWL